MCIMAMEEGLDTGDYCVCRSLPAGSRTAAELTEELAALGASALLTALAQAEAATCAGWPRTRRWSPTPRRSPKAN